MKYQSAQLENGIRIVHCQVKSMVGYCGMMINTGSRDESDDEHGMAHFIEHVIFKGTKKRKSFHILSRLEDVGGEINAFTTKEETCYHATFLKSDYERATELIQDILFHSIFPKKEIDKEKEVIIDEINSYKDSPAELIFDDFEELIFRDHALGRNILGREESIMTFNQTDIHDFMNKKYNTDEMVFCSVADLPFKKVEYFARKYFGDIPANLRTENRSEFKNYQAENIVIDKNTYQAHCLIGNLAYNYKDERRTALILLNNVLGGQGLNSRLNLSLREKHGYAYNVESSFTPYFDTGNLSIYFGTDPENLEKSIQLTHKELDKLKTTKLGSLQLSRAKKQLIGQIAISSENNENLLLSMGKSFLLFNHFEDLEAIQKKVEAISAEELMHIANEVLDKEQLSMLIYK